MALVKAFQSGVRGNERINAFSDGVFAIAVTLLVLELKVPEHLPQGGLAELLPELLPKFLGHVISFIVLGIYWVGQHNMFLHIKRHDRVLLWLNNLFLLAVASMPFFAGLITHYADDRIALIAYAANLVVAGLMLAAIWNYATAGRRLVAADMADDMVAFVRRRVLLAPALYAVSIAVAFFSPLAARLIFVVVALLYIVPNPLDHFHHRELNTGALVEMNDESEGGAENDSAD